VLILCLGAGYFIGKPAIPKAEPKWNPDAKSVLFGIEIVSEFEKQFGQAKTQGKRDTISMIFNNMKEKFRTQALIDSLKQVSK
jgi:hypothetical protein